MPLHSSSAPAAPFLPPRVSGDDEPCPTLIPKDELCVCGCVCLYVCASVVLDLLRSTRPGSALPCARGPGWGGPMGYKTGPCPFPLWSLAFEWGWGSGRGQVNVHVVLCNRCVLKSLVLLCERTSPPGAHEVYMQNNKRQMHNHRCCQPPFCGSGHLAQRHLGQLPEPVSNHKPFYTFDRGTWFDFLFL